MKITLVGSSRFIDEYRAVNRRLTLAGHVVYTIAVVSTQAQERVKAEEVITPDEKEMLDLVHLQKIMESDAVYLVTDETGYYGDSTRRELKWAGMLEKPIYLGKDLERQPLDFHSDFREFVKARSSKDPEALNRYYQRIHGNEYMNSAIGGLAGQTQGPQRKR